MNQFPSARSENIVVQNINKELLIYDLEIHKAYCLNETSALVYQSCDGNSSVKEISDQISGKFKSPVTEELVWLAIDQLKENNLLQNGEAFNHEEHGALTRREAIRRAGLSSMIALPFIATLIAPLAANAQSRLPATCGATCTCIGGGNINPLNAFCTEPVNTCQGFGNCQCFATNCPADTTQPCTGYCASLV